MVNQDQLSILQQGTRIWNAWRRQHLEASIDLAGADLNGVDLIGANLSNANLSGADLIRANLSGANLSGADLSRTNLIIANLSGANLSGANLSGSDPFRANLSEANLSRANLNGADLSRANLSEANLSEASLNETDLRRANLSGANLSGANLSRATTLGTVFGDLDLRQTKGLETIQHQGPSIIGTDTLERSQGSVPEVFLRGAGLSDTFITYVRSLVQQPVQYYTCVISYSSKDQDFAERLYADLQNKGVRCQYAPKDLEIEDAFLEQVEQVICAYDKHVVVLSGHSLHSSWIEDEIRVAQEREERFKKEQHLKKTVLFPVQIDTSIDRATVQWVTQLRTQRHISSFIGWRSHERYQKAFQCLLSDLQQEATKDR